MAIRYAPLTALFFALLAGCASRPTEIQPQYVSPLQFQDHDCEQVSAEVHRIHRKSQRLYHRLDKTAADDEAQMAVGMILFWPALFFLEGGDGPEASEYARLAGEIDALEDVAVEKGCDTAKFEEIRAQEQLMREKKQAREQEEAFQRPGA